MLLLLRCLVLTAAAAAIFHSNLITNLALVFRGLPCKDHNLRITMIIDNDQHTMGVVLYVVACLVVIAL